MAPKKRRGRAAKNSRRGRAATSSRGGPVVEYEPKPDCGPLDVENDPKSDCEPLDVVDEPKPDLDYKSCKLVDGVNDEEIWTRGSKGENLKAAGDSHNEGKNEASSLLTKHHDRSHPNITDLHLLPTNYHTRPKKIKFPQPSDSDLDLEVDDDETQTDGSEGEELKVAGDSNSTEKNEGSKGEDLEAAGDFHGEGKNEASSPLTKHPYRSYPNITDLHLLPINYHTRLKKIKFPQPSDPDLDLEVDDDETDGEELKVAGDSHSTENNEGSEGEEFKVAGDSYGMGKNEGSEGNELKAPRNSHDDDCLSHGVEHLNVNDPEKKVNGKKRKFPCSICLSLDHTIGSCQCRKSCPAGTTLAPHYDIVCKCCGELGGHPNHKNWEGRAVRKICGRCHSSGHWFWNCTIKPPP